MEQIIEAGASVRPKSGNRLLVRIIDAGKGSSGFYPEETLKRAAEDGVFESGLQLYADHPGELERMDRPERSIRDIAGVLTSGATWDEKTKSLVAEAKTFEPWTEKIRAMSDVIGLSIRASAEVSEADGERVIERITEAQSVDFVTKAGRGGKILSLLESVRPRANETKEADMPDTQVSEAAKTVTELNEALDAKRTLEGQLREANDQLDSLNSDNAKLQEALDASQQAARVSAAEAILAESGAEFTTLERKGLLAELPIIAESSALDAEAFKQTVEQAAKESAERSGSGSVRGLGQDVGESIDSKELDVDKYIREAFGHAAISEEN